LGFHLYCVYLHMTIKQHNMENLQSAIVKYKGGFYKVSADRGKGDKRWVNLKSIFGRTIYYKQVPVSEVEEAEAEWYTSWTQSDAYRSM